MKRIACLSLGLVMAASVASCSGKSASSSSEDNVDRGTDDKSNYDFQIAAAGEPMVRVDAMGVALISTVLMNRDRTTSGGDNKNQYQIATPDVQGNLLSFLHFLRSMHKYWHDDLARQGFEPCSSKTFGIIAATPCTLQKLRFDEDPALEGPRVVDVTVPDYITVDFDKPLRFPNGRPPWERITDKVLALGFLKFGGKCGGLDKLPGVSEETKARVPRDKDGVPICTIETFSDLSLQVPENDRPFPKTFPYLAAPWFYAQSNAGSYFWPTTRRMDLPE